MKFTEFYEFYENYVKIMKIVKIENATWRENRSDPDPNKSPLYLLYVRLDRCALLVAVTVS